MTRKSGKHIARDIRKHWTAVSTLLDLISSVFRDLPHLRLNQQPQNAELKLYMGLEVTVSSVKGTDVTF